MSSRIEIPRIFPLVEDEDPIQVDLIQICLSTKELTDLYSGKELVFEIAGQPKIIIAKSLEN